MSKVLTNCNMTLGEIPTSYLESMTYAEFIAWMCNYLDTYLKPTIDEIVDTINEMQDYIIEGFDDAKEYTDTKILELKNYVDGLIGDINAVLDTINEVFADLNNKTQFNLLKNTPILFIGDSYLTFTNNYFTYYKTYTGISDSNAYKYASGGAGFYSTGTGGKTFSNLLDDAIAGMTSDQKQSVKIIVVGTCVNDANYNATSTQLVNGISSFMTKVHTNYPNAKVYCIASGNILGQTQDAFNKRRNYLTTVLATLINTSSSRPDFTYIDNSHLWLINESLFNEDGIHPNDSGSQQIALRLIKALNGGHDIIDYTGRLNFSFTSDTANASPVTQTCNLLMLNDFVQFNFNDMTLDRQSFTNNQFQDVGTWTSNIIHTTQYNGIQFTCPLEVIQGGNRYSISATIRLWYDGKIYMRTNSGGMSNVTQYKLLNTTVRCSMHFI